MDNTSLDIGLNDGKSYDYDYDYSNFNYYFNDHDYINNFVFVNLFALWSFDEAAFIQFVATCITISVSLPLNLWAIYGLCSQVRNGEAAPIYVINLLISDLLQFICIIVEAAQPKDLNYTRYDNYMVILDAFLYLYAYSMMVSICFMVCISLERYQIIVHPLWYHCRRTIKNSVMICVAVWIVPVAFVLTWHFSVDSIVYTVTFLTFYLLPLPLLLFFLVTTLKALSASISVLTDEKHRIAGMLIMVLLNYLLLFLPGIFMILIHQIPYGSSHLCYLYVVASMFLKLSPLADLVLYIILRKGTIRQLSACVCCCRKQSNETSAVTVSTVTMSTVPSCQLMQRNMERGGERTEEV